jgi:nucleoside-diphosphate-sugar epimerase
MAVRNILVTGAGGFIGGHLVKRLLDEGEHVTAVDIKGLNQWHQVHKVGNVDYFDLSSISTALKLQEYRFGEVYQLAADMGGMGFIETNKLECMLTVLTTTNVLMVANVAGWGRVTYASSACVYPGYLQNDTSNIDRGYELSEDDAYPADPEDGYGWEKLFGERMHRHFREDRNLETRVVRFHNVYGPHGSWIGGREKAPAALCRKVAHAKLTGTTEVEVWGDGTQLRSFCYVDDAVEGMLRVGRGAYVDAVNVGSAELVSVNDLLDVITFIADYDVSPKYIPGPLGVKGRSSDNTLIKELYGWEPSIPFTNGMRKTYDWIEEQVQHELELGGERL